MSTDLYEVLKRLENLSVEELLTVQASLNEGVRHKQQLVQPALPIIKVPGAYQPTVQEIEIFLASIMTPQELARLGTTDFRHKDLGPKPASQLLIEDR